MRLKTQIIFGLMLVASIFLATLAIVYRTSVSIRFQEIEYNAARKDMERCLEAIHREVIFLEMLTKDWAAWDDTYRFVQDRNQDFIDSNLTSTTFKENKLNFVLITNQKGITIWKKAYDFNADKNLDPHKFILTTLPEYSSLLVHPFVRHSVSGIIQTLQGPLLVASHPIVQSNYVGQMNGTLIMGRLLDDRFIKQIASQTRLNFKVTPISEDKISEHELSILKNLSIKNPIEILKESNDLLYVYAVYFDINSQPGLLIQMYYSREVIKPIRAIIASYLWIISGLFTFLIIIFGIYIVKSFIDPVVRLSKTPFTSPIPATGFSLSTPSKWANRKDEIGILSHKIDQMRQCIEKWQASCEKSATDKTLELHAKCEELHEILDAMYARLEKSESINTIKSRFITNLSTEIRTPLNGIIGMTSLLFDTSLSPDQKEYVDDIAFSADRLIEISNDILNFTTLDQKGFKCEPTDFNLKTLIDDVEEMARIKCLRKNIDFMVNIGDNVPVRLHSDRKMISQIIFNLLENAIKFTESGSVKLSVQLKEQKYDLVRIFVSVTDTGIGISEEQKKILFSSFSHARYEMTREYGGLGLGLAICKHFCELLEGKIGFESQEGMGSIFWFTITCRKTL